MSNFTKRFVFGIIYVLLVVYATVYNPIFFLLLFFVFMNFCIYEFTKMIKLKSALPYLLGILSFYCINYADELNSSHIETKLIISIFILLLFYPFIKMLFSKNENIATYIGKLFTSYFYIVVPFSLLLAIPVFSNLTTKYDSKIILGVFILIWTNDTFAYLIGKKIGKHKLFERISPKKTMEGFVGGFIFTLIVAFILSTYFMPEIKLLHWLVIATIVSVFGTLGDLIESSFKRQANIKDSSNLIPGHGGFLDRLDSIIFAIPFIFIYLILIQ